MEVKTTNEEPFASKITKNNFVCRFSKRYSSTMATPAAKLEKLRALLAEHNLQAYIVPSDDAHQVFSSNCCI
jgi:hypothetical protein